MFLKNDEFMAVGTCDFSCAVANGTRSRTIKGKGGVILFDKCMGVSDSCCKKTGSPLCAVVSLSHPLRVASLDSIFQLE